ncbi:MAG: NADP-dependent oxidoreductase [Cryobacterium sp.]|nr:NADP-dependent oxidoreductase [Cryobacterium sp.]MBX3103424.1 NADP-dependent oxidoreductase [Cryobacterium sp.]
MPKAVSFSRFGGPKVLELIDIELPEPQSGEVQVQVRSAGVNPWDFKVRRGYIPGHQLPSRQGVEFAGVVRAIGADISNWSVGDEVIGWIGNGAQAEFVTVPERQLATKPTKLDWNIAGGLGLSANTARRSIDSLDLGPEDTVLVTGAAGGVGVIAIQFAKALGAKVVGTASSRNHEFLSSLGITPITYGDGELERLRAAAPQGYTAALDTVGDIAIETALALEIPPARIDTIASNDASEKYGVLSVGGGKKNSTELTEFARAASANELVLPIRGAYPMDEVVRAYRDLESGHGLGKIVLTVNN